MYRWQDKFVNTVCSIHHTFQTHLLHFISHSLNDLWTRHVQTLLALKADSRVQTYLLSLILAGESDALLKTLKREKESRGCCGLTNRKPRGHLPVKNLFSKRSTKVQWHEEIQSFFTTGKKLFYDSSKRFGKPEKRLVKYWVLGKSDQELNDLSSY